MGTPRPEATWVAPIPDTLLTGDPAVVVLRRETVRLAFIAALQHLDPAAPDSVEVERALLERYVDAFERYDVDALVALLHEDAIITMPPFELWLQGVRDIRAFLAGMRDEGGHDRLLSLRANGCPALAVHRPDAAGTPAPYAIMVLEITGDRIAAIHASLDTSLFSAFGLAPGDQFSPPAQL
jgi:RNA polymerase sigma-70 factor (ECF subfamily)